MNKGVVGMMKKIISELDEKVKVREEALKAQREIIPLCAQAIRDVQKGKVDKAWKSAKKIDMKIKRIEKLLKKHPDMVKPVLGTAYQEYAELMIFLNYLKNKKLPVLSIPAEYYLLGLGDAIGELKRVGMQFLAEGRIREAEGLYDELEELYYKFSEFVYPNSIVPGLKQKQDTARRVLNAFSEQLLNFRIHKQFLQ